MIAKGFLEDIHGLGATVHSMECDVTFKGVKFGSVLFPETEVTSYQGATNLNPNHIPQ